MRVLVILLVTLWFGGCLEAVPAQRPLASQATRKIVLRLNEGVDPMAFASRNGLQFVSSYLPKILPRMYVMKASGKTKLLGLKGEAYMKSLNDHADVEWADHQVKTYKFKRGDLSARIVDPEYHNQWHLSGLPGVSLRVEEALRQGLDGTGVVIGVVDDGVQGKHPDLSPRMKKELCWDFNDDHKTDPTPWGFDGHGTAAAGMAAASRNSKCGIGVASGASIAGLRLLGGAVTDMVEASALSYKRDEIHVYSNSWGPVDDGKRFSAPGRLTKLVLEAGATEGRNGKGNIFVWAAGNGRQHKDNCNRDGYASNRHTLAVGAINHAKQTSYYSEPCAELLVVVPSSGHGYGLVTTDLMGGNGYSKTDCTDKFGGTSGAAPQIAGVAALMLQLRPELTKRDVEGILAKSAVRVNPTQEGWSKNARGYFHHHDYGFGHVDLKRVIDQTRRWDLLPAQKVCDMKLTGINRKIPMALGIFGAHTTEITVSSSCGISFVEHIEVKTYLRHTCRGRVMVAVTDPEGITSILTSVSADCTRNYPIGGWTFGSIRHWGSRAQGVWKFHVYDTMAGHTGTVDWVHLTIYGH